MMDGGEYAPFVSPPMLEGNFIQVNIRALNYVVLTSVTNLLNNEQLGRRIALSVTRGCVIQLKGTVWEFKTTENNYTVEEKFISNFLNSNLGILS